MHIQLQQKEVLRFKDLYNFSLKQIQKKENKSSGTDSWSNIYVSLMTV